MFIGVYRIRSILVPFSVCLYLLYMCMFLHLFSLIVSDFVFNLCSTIFVETLFSGSEKLSWNLDFRASAHRVCEISCLHLLNICTSLCFFVL